ncbi:unnamed protein product [Cuscuta europaea]|nr:unnamed protein product [Cuscuta europaea]
MPQSAI